MEFNLIKMNITEVENILLRLLEPDNNVIKQVLKIFIRYNINVSKLFVV